MAVRQIENLLSLLEWFAERGRAAKLSDIVAHFGWPRSSAYNMLTTLVDCGYLFEPTARGGYYPSSRWQHLSAAFWDAEPVPESLQRVVIMLSSQTGETAYVSAASGLFAVALHVAESNAAVRYTTRPGKRIPIHITATGQALLSQMAHDDLAVLLRKASFEGLVAGAPSNVAAVMDNLERGRRRGWYHAAANHSPDLGGVAVPVRLHDRVYAITVAGPLYRVNDKAAEHAHAIVAAIADELAYEERCCTKRIEG